MSHRYILSELRTKQAAAANRKGVVGKRGRKMPAMPRPSASMPTDKRSNLRIRDGIIGCYFRYHRYVVPRGCLKVVSSLSTIKESCHCLTVKILGFVPQPNLRGFFWAAVDYFLIAIAIAIAIVPASCLLRPASS
jgi:hypothetical protein